MEPVSNEVIERLIRKNKTRGIILKSDDLRSGLPIVSIGSPETWALTDLYPAEKMPPLLKAKLNEADFYLVRFSCSFRPQHGEKQIDWARFIVQLYSGEAGQPIAFDLYPVMVTQELKHSIKVTLGPTLNFQPVNAGLGGLEFGYEYQELHPIITAAGIGEENPSWDFREAKGSTVQGSKFMLMLLKVPKGMKPVEAFIDLVASVKIRDQVLPINISKRDISANPLKVRLISA